MTDFPIDPELRVRGRPTRVLRSISQATDFLRGMLSTHPGGPWDEALHRLEAVRTEDEAIEAVVALEVMLETHHLLVEEAERAPKAPSRSLIERATTEIDTALAPWTRRVAAS